MDFEEANSQVDSLCGALPRDNLRMHKCIKSDISKVMYQMKCMDPLHASPTINLSDPNQTSKMLVVIQIQTVRHTYGIGWYFKSRLASVLKTNWYTRKNKSIFYF